MIEVAIFKKNNLIRAVSIKGHAYDDEEDYEIICASVSTLSHTLINYLKDSLNLKENELKVNLNKSENDENKISIEVSDDAILRKDVQSGFSFFEIGILGLNYDEDELVKLKYQEV